MIEELSTLKELLDYYCNNKTSYKVVSDKVKYRPHQVVKDELFNPKDPRNVETEQLMVDIGILMSETMFKEFRDEKKETFKNI